MSHALIIGGSSGLGLELGRQLANEGDVTITGRTDPKVEFADYKPLDLSEDAAYPFEQLLRGIGEVSTLVYAAGFYQEGHLDELDREQVREMINVGALNQILILQEVMKTQGRLDEYITISSTSGYVAREKESAYSFVKAGSILFAEAISKDPSVEKVLAISPSGMDTPIWRNTPGKDTSKMLHPSWVAQQIMLLRDTVEPFTEAKILGAFNGLPDRVEIIKPILG